jgi:sigma-54 specific flagellar transcriptional regulator A
VRELENLVERLSVCVEGTAIRVADLPSHLRPDSAEVTPFPVSPVAHAPDAEAPTSAAEVRALFRAPEPLPSPEAAPTFEDDQPVDLPGMLRRLEDAYIDAALSRTRGNKKAAADLLGLQRTTLVEKLRRRQRDAAAPAV